MKSKNPRTHRINEASRDSCTPAWVSLSRTSIPCGMAYGLRVLLTSCATGTADEAKSRRRSAYPSKRTIRSNYQKVRGTVKAGSLHKRFLCHFCLNAINRISIFLRCRQRHQHWHIGHAGTVCGFAAQDAVVEFVPIPCAADGPGIHCTILVEKKTTRMGRFIDGGGVQGANVMDGNATRFDFQWHCFVEVWDITC